MAEMRFAGSIFFCLPATVMAYSEPAPFDAAREVLEIRCLECHTAGEAKGGLVMENREAFIHGGDSGTSLKPGDPGGSPILNRVLLSADDEDRMPPKKHGEPMTKQEIEVVSRWIEAGAPWTEGQLLAPKAQTALPRWDALPDPQIASIEAFPKQVRLESAADFHRVIVIARFKDASTHDITQQSKLTLADPALATLRGTALFPKADGSTALRIDYRGLSTEVPVTVIDAAKPRPVSFQLDVMPVLTAAGCNTGSCHGSARGQDGFHLSLYGFDPKGDHFRLTTEMAGRRINLALPEDSLVITKSLGTVPHTGGKLIKADSSFYKTLVEWIRDGARYDAGEIAQPTGIEV
jgi:hypothetical protein